MTAGRLGLALWCAWGLAGVVGARGAEAPDPFAALVAQTDPLPPEEQRAKFRLPPGFEIQLVAAEPEIQKPINLAFDAAGNLYATQSVEYPYPAADGSPRRDMVKVFAGLDAAGRPREIRTFAAGLNIPIGVLPLADGALVYSIPEISRHRDTNGDGLADERQPLYGPFGYQDTHGMCSSFRRWVDGWVYACHGFANSSTVRGGDGHEICMHSGNTYRLRLDGSRIEYFTHGQVNPFGLAFDPWGNLYSSDCHSLPLYQLLRGAYYPSFGKPDDGLGFGPHALNHLHGSTGIAGVVVYAAAQFPPEYRGTVFIGNPVTGRINHDRFEDHGTTRLAIELPDFVSCDDPWFRPVDLRLGPDGALYVADFYNAVIGHYEVPLAHPRRDREKGRIWRIVYRGTDGQGAIPPLPNLATAELPELVQRLADVNLENRVAATHQLVDRFGAAAVEPVSRAIDAAAISPWPRAYGLWVLERLGALDDERLARLCADPAAEVRVQAIKCLAERAEWPSPWGERVLAALDDPEPFVRRAAADALGRHPSAEHLAPLLALWEATDPADTHLMHVVRMALRDQLLAPGMYDQVRRLVAAEPPESDAAARFAELSLGVPTGDSAEYLLAWLDSTQLNVGPWERALQQAARYLPAERLPIVAELVQPIRRGDVGRQLAAIRALHRGYQERGAAWPPGLVEWSQTLATSLLIASDDGAVRQGIDLARDLRLAASHPRLVELVASVERSAETIRGPALGACVAIDGPASVGPLAALIENAAEPIGLRQHAARELANVPITAARQRLAAALVTAPSRLALEIAQGLANNDEGATLLVDAASAGKIPADLLTDWGLNLRLNGRQVPGLKERLAALTAGLPPADVRLRQLVDERRDRFVRAQTEPVRGQALFEKHCALCHRVGGRGAKIGPELDGIGNRGLDRLLEDVLDPNRNVDQAFRASTLVLADGRVLSGLVLREEGSVLVLATSEGKEERLPLAEIDERTVGSHSPMPANVADRLSEAEFFDLIAFLLATPRPDATAGPGR